MAEDAKARAANMGPHELPGWNFEVDDLYMWSIDALVEGFHYDSQFSVDYLKVENDQQNDAGTGADAGNDFSSATSITPGNYIGELYSPYDTEDWYQFYAASNHVIYVILTPPVGADFDLRLYNPSGTLKASAIGTEDYIVFTTDSSGYWRAQLFISSGEGQYSLDIWVQTPSPPNTGCPYVSVWNGTDYVLDNNLIPAAEHSNGTDVIDYYRLQQPLTRGNGKYSLLIWNLDKHSFLDQVKLLAVDHESDVNIAVSPCGEILTYKNPVPAATAIDQDNQDVTSILNAVDGNYFEGYAGDSILLDFGSLNVSEGAKLVLRTDIQCINPPCEIKDSIHVQVLNATGSWVTVASFIPRMYWSTDILNLSSYLPNINGNVQLRLYFTAHHKIDYAGLDTTSQDEFETHYGNLVMAHHNRLGNVKRLLKKSDNQYVELLPSEQVLVQFTLPQNHKEKRDFIITLEGHYFKTD
jgi:hypothetical protein